jgi:Leucine Rich repeat
MPNLDRMDEVVEGLLAEGFVELPEGPVPTEDPPPPQPPLASDPAPTEPTAVSTPLRRTLEEALAQEPDDRTPPMPIISRNRASGYLPPDMVRAVLHSGNLPNLRHLRLRGTSIGDAGCEEIVRSGILRRLKTLDLRHGCITDKGARRLTECSDFRNLEFLDLRRNSLTAAGVLRLLSLSVNVHAHDRLGPDNVSNGEYLFEGDQE